MALILKTVGVSFTNSSLPVLRRDSIANAGTLDILDALDSYSWSKQSAPSVSDTWVSLIGSNTGSFAGTVGFSAGFTTNEAASAAGGDMITLPDTFRFTTGQERCVIVWMKPGTQPTFVGTHPLFGWGKTGTADSPYVMYMNSANNVITTTGIHGGTKILTLPVTIGAVQQFAFSFEIIGGNYTVKVFKNGSLSDTFASGVSVVAKTGRNAECAGSGYHNRNYFAGTFYRAVSDDLSVVTPEALVAADYAAYSGRFT